MLKKFLLVFAGLIVVIHIAWYAAGRSHLNRGVPDEKSVKQYLADYNSRIKTNIDTAVIEETYIDANGFRLHLDVFPSGVNMPTIVFIPGTSVYAQLYVEFMYEMHKRGFNVVGFDPRGHGRSSGLRGDYTINELTDDALAVVKYSRERFKGKIALAGSSQGGIAAFYTAARDDSLSAVVCHNIADINGRDNLVLSKVKMHAWSSPYVEKIMGIYKGFAVPVSYYLDLKREITRDGRDAERLISENPLCVTWISMRAFRSLLHTELAKPVEKITVPVMLIHAERDNIFPQEYVESIYKKLTCRKEYLLLKDEEHLVMTNRVDKVKGPVSKWLKDIMR